MNQQLSKNTIYEKLQQHQPTLKKYGVQKIGLFGSFVRGESSETSDIDFLVDFEKGKKNLDNLIGLGDFLEELFQKKIDLVTPQGLSPYIGPRILKEVEYVRLRA